MAGFAGFFNTNGDKNDIDSMISSIDYRGNDYHLYYKDDGLNLGFTGLDTAYLFDKKELFESDDNVVLLVGYLSNIDEVREYVSKTYDKKDALEYFPSQLIESIYQKEQIKCASLIKGNYVVFVYEKNTKKLIIIRDRFGTQPVYYYPTSDGLIFASEIKSLIKHRDFKKEFNNEALVPYLVFQVPALSETFFKGLFTFEPGYYLEFADGKIDIRQYFDIDFDIEDISLEEASEKIEQLLDKSLKERIKYYKSKENINAYLSSGVDSSYLVAKFLPKKTFTVGYNDKEFSEIDNAKALAKMLDIDNVSEVIDSDVAFSKLNDIVKLLEMPYANLSAIPMYFVSKKAKEYGNTVLVGDGSDEIFGGYYDYTEPGLVPKYKKLPLFLRKILGRFAKNTDREFKGKHILVRGLPVEEWYIGHAKIFSQKAAINLVKNDYKKSKSIKDILKPHYDKVQGKPDLIKKQYLDFHIFMINDISVKSDRMNIGNGIQTIAPILDEDILEYSRKLPVNLKVNGMNGKVVFRNLSKKFLPEEWSKRKKIGYVVPLKKWLKEEKYSSVIREKIMGETAKKFFDVEEIKRLYDLNMQNKRETHRQLWTIFMFILWYEEFFE